MTQKKFFNLEIRNKFFETLLLSYLIIILIMIYNFNQNSINNSYKSFFFPIFQKILFFLINFQKLFKNNQNIIYKMNCTNFISVNDKNDFSLNLIENNNIIKNEENNIINKEENNIINKEENNIINKVENNIINKIENNNINKEENNIINKENNNKIENYYEEILKEKILILENKLNEFDSINLKKIGFYEIPIYLKCITNQNEQKCPKLNKFEQYLENYSLPLIDNLWCKEGINLSFHFYSNNLIFLKDLKFFNDSLNFKNFLINNQLYNFEKKIKNINIINYKFIINPLNQNQILKKFCLSNFKIKGYII